MLRSAHLVFALLFITVLAACGQKGALYLPEAENSPVYSEDTSEEQPQEKPETEPSLDN